MTSDPWRGGLAWTAGFLAFPIAVSALAVEGYKLLTAWHPMVPVYMVSWLGYTVGCWVAVYGVWLWSSRRGIADKVFIFRQPTGRDWGITLAGAAVGIVILYPVSQWLAQVLFGVQMRGMSFDIRQPFVLPVVLVWAVLTAPLAEEVLFRGLAVAYLQARRWPTWAIGVVCCIAFAAIHLPYFGVAGATLILFWGGMVVAIRLWRGNLMPGWILHIVNNVVAYIAIPLLR
jgi:membrane protease YdiL (CAAX protease family)